MVAKYTNPLDLFNLSPKASPTTSDLVPLGDASTTGVPMTQALVGNLPFVQLAGSTMTGPLILSADPTVSLGAVTKEYADAISEGLFINQSCFAATTADLGSIVYNNGASGVGATLTNAGSFAAFTVDGTTPATNARILVKNQTNTYQNGIYALTTPGSGLGAWVLTRTTDYDTTSEIVPGNFVITDNGTVNANLGWIQTATVSAIGSGNPITFSQFGYPPINYPVSVADGGTGQSTLTTAYGLLAAGTTPTGVVQTISPGTVGQVLLSNGASSLPSMGAPLPSSGNQVLVASSTSTSSATVDFANVFTGAYDIYCLLIENFSIVNNGETIELLVGTGPTPTYETSDYSGGYFIGSASAGGNYSAASYIALTHPLDFSTLTSGNVGAFMIYFFNVNSSNFKTVTMLGTYASFEISGQIPTSVTVGAQWEGSDVVTSFRLLTSNGNITTGNYYLYGIKPT